MSEYDTRRAVTTAREEIGRDRTRAERARQADSQQILEAIKRLDKARADDNRLLAEAFNKMTQAITGLAKEVGALRADLNPQKLDKPKLPPPQG